MRWLRVAALFLLAVLPLFLASDGDQSTSIPPSPTLPTNDDNYDNSSLPNAPDNSSILVDSALNETSSTISSVVSLVDNSTAEAQKSTVDSVEKEEEPTDIEDSTHNGLDSTSSEEEYDDDEKDEAAPSQVDRPQADPSQLGSDVQSQPQSGEITPVQTNDTENYDGLSSDQLKIKLDAATTELDEAKKATQKANEALDAKKKAAEQPNKDYDEKKTKWEELEKIAVEKETAEREYDEANDNVTHILVDFSLAEDEFDRKKEELTEAETIKEEIPKWPVQKQNAETEQQTKKDGKQPLEKKVNQLQKDLATKKTNWNNALRNAKPILETYDADKCDEAPQSTSTMCVRLRSERDRLNVLSDNAKTEYDTTELSINTTQKALDDLLKEISALDTEIGRLKNKIDDITPDIINERINKLKGELKEKNDNYEIVKSKKEEAESNLEKKRIAKEEADQSDGGISTQIARRDAVRAKMMMDDAREIKDKADKEVKEHQAIFDKAEETEKKLEKKVKLLEDKYAEAKKKEEPQKGSSVVLPVVGASVGVLLLIGVGIGGYFLYTRRFRKKREHTKVHIAGSIGGGESGSTAKKKGVKGDKKGKNDGKQRQGTADIAGAGAANKPLTGSSQSSSKQQTAQTQSSGGSSVHHTDGAAAGSADPPKIAGGETQTPKDGYGEIPDPRTSPFIPGEEPHKIPARLFTWEGPLVRRTRWHGDGTHDLEGKQGPEKLEHLRFDPNLNRACETGAGEIMEDGGPPSDSNRSEWFNYLDEYENAKKAWLAYLELDKKPNKTREDKTELDKLWKEFTKLDEIREKAQAKHSKNRSQSTKEPSGRDRSRRDRDRKEKSAMEQSRRERERRATRKLLEKKQRM